MELVHGGVGSRGLGVTPKAAKVNCLQYTSLAEMRIAAGSVHKLHTIAAYNYVRFSAIKQAEQASFQLGHCQCRAAPRQFRAAATM